MLGALLTYGPRATADESATSDQRLIVVVPRPGTISPWSSKATDIAHVCGLDAVRASSAASPIGFATDAAAGRRDAAMRSRRRCSIA